jgi:hypothetical protein
VDGSAVAAIVSVFAAGAAVVVVVLDAEPPGEGVGAGVVHAVSPSSARATETATARRMETRAGGVRSVMGPPEDKRENRARQAYWPVAQLP